jgi:hypothetical protein
MNISWSEFVGPQHITQFFYGMCVRNALISIENLWKFSHGRGPTRSTHGLYGKVYVILQATRKLVIFTKGSSVVNYLAVSKLFVLLHT